MPSSAPSLSIQSEWLEKLDISKQALWGSSPDYASAMTTRVTYSEVVLGGHLLVSDSCSQWSQALSKLSSTTIANVPVRVSLLVLKSPSQPIVEATNITCDDMASDNDLVGSLVSAFSSSGSQPGYRRSVSCSTSKERSTAWIVSSCGDSVCLRVNVSSTTRGGDATSSESFLLSPCGLKAPGGGAFSRAEQGYVRLLSFSFVYRYPPPSLVTLSATMTRTSASISATFSFDGLVSCSAWPQTSSLPTTMEVLLLSSVSKWSSGGLVSLTVTGLLPSTIYSIVCTSQSAQGSIADLQTALSSRKAFTTLCCKVVTVNVGVKSAFAGTGSIDKAVSVLLSAAPTSSISLRVETYRLGGDSSTSSTAAFSPATTSVSSRSSLASTYALLPGSVGMFLVNVTVMGPSAHEFAVVYAQSDRIEVISVDSAPIPPALTSAQFAADGSSVVATFDTLTDRAMLGTKLFMCSLLFNFTDSGLAVCQWSASGLSVDVRFPHSSNVQVGSSLALRANTLRMACPAAIARLGVNCSSWIPAPSTTVRIQSPPVAFIPVVVVSSVSTLGLCEDFVLDLSASFGSGGRAWQSMSFLVTSDAPDAVVLEQVLNSPHMRVLASVSNVFVVESSNFTAGHVYGISIALCNFLSSCGQTLFSLTVGSLPTPSVNVVGPDVVFSTRGKAVSLKAAAYTPSCSGLSSAANLKFSWSLTIRHGDVFGNSVDLNSLQIASTAPSLYIPAFKLATLTTYVATVSVVNTKTLAASSVSVQIAVGQGSLVAAVAGGSYRTVRIQDEMMLDASNSYDEDQGGFGNAGLTFSWACYRQLPVYSPVCSLAWANRSDLAVVGVLFGEDAVNGTYMITVSVADSRQVSRDKATATVSLFTTIADVPQVQLISSEAELVHVSASSKIVVLASVVSLSGSAVCQWTVDDPSIDLSLVALTQPLSILATPSPMNLVLSANALADNVQYVFALNCALVKSPTVIAVSSVMVTTNGAPLPGLFTVIPTSGTELVTPFKFSAGAWTDAASDYPLTYASGFLSPNRGAYLKVSARSSISSMSTTLPSGLASQQYLVTCQLQVFDSLGASVLSTVSVTVQASAVNASYVSSMLQSRISGAGQDSDSLLQALMSTAVALNAVNCSVAPNCTTLRRSPCGVVANKCGPCLEGIGSAGYSNDPCLPLSSVTTNAAVDARRCAVDKDCMSGWYKCNVTSSSCYSPTKTCADDCNQVGQCQFTDTLSGYPVESCSIKDVACAAVCVCNLGYYGESCLLTATDLRAKQDNRALLVSTLNDVIEGGALDDSNGLSAWTANVLEVTAGPSELNSQAVLTSASMISNVINAAAASSIPFSDSSASEMLDALNQCMTGLQLVQSGPSSQSELQHLSASSGVSMSFKESVDGMCESMLNEAVVGQSTQEFIRDNFRLNVLVVPGSSSEGSNAYVSIATPVSASENASGILSSLAAFPANAASTRVAVTSLKSAIFSTFKASPSETGKLPRLDAFLANPLRIVQDLGDKCDNSAHGPIKLMFRHVAEVNATALLLTTNVTFTAMCRAGEPGRVSWACAHGSNVSHYCSGSSTYSVTVQCPKRVVTPSCSLVTDDGASLHCEVVRFSDMFTECACDVCEVVRSGRRLLSASAKGELSLQPRPRRLSSAAMNDFVYEIQAITSYVISDYAAITKGAASFGADDVQNATLVLVLFGSIWGVMMLAIAVIEYGGYVDKVNDYTKKRFGLTIGYGPRLGSKTQRQVAPSADTVTSVSQARTFLKQYVDSFFPNIFREKPRAVRFVHELLHKHRYLSVLGRDKGYEKFVKALETLTVLTTYMFLTAVLYDAEWPNDNGQCATKTTEVLCLQQKSLFNRAVSMCSWDPSMEGFECVWMPPVFAPVVQIVITMLVVGFSGPINVIVSYTVYYILLGPSQEEIQERERVVSVRRGSVMQALGGLHPEDTRVHTLAHDGKRDILPSILTKRRESTSLLSITLDVDESLREYFAGSSRLDSFCFDSTDRGSQARALVKAANQESLRQAESTSSWSILSWRKANVPRAVTPETQDNNNDTSHDIVSYEYSDVNKLLQGLRDHAHRLQGDDQEEFEAQWGQVLGKHVFADSHLIPLRVELLKVNEEAALVIDRLSGKPPKLIGIEILELFVQDLMGKESKPAKIFKKQRASVLSKLVVSVWLKALAILLILCLNGYFVFMCMLYADSKGRQWQRNWAMSCAVYVVVDVFVKNVHLVFLVYYFIPDLITKHTQLMRERLDQALHRLASMGVQRQKLSRQSRSGESTVKALSRRRQEASDVFSATDYLFVSAHVARAFPNVLESSIVKAYRSMTVSTEQSLKWTNLGTEHAQLQGQRLKQRNPPRTEIDETEVEPSAFVSMVRSVTQHMGSIMVSLLITLGCQDLLIQSLVVQTIDPMFVGFVAYLGSLMFHDAAVGLIVLVIVMMLLLVLCAFGYYQYNQRRSVVTSLNPELLDLESGKSMRSRRSVHATSVDPVDEESDASDSSRGNAKEHGGDEDIHVEVATIQNVPSGELSSQQSAIDDELSDVSGFSFSKYCEAQKLVAEELHSDPSNDLVSAKPNPVANLTVGNDVAIEDGMSDGSGFSFSEYCDAKRLVAEYLHSEASNTLAVMSAPDPGTGTAYGDDIIEDGMSDGSRFSFGEYYDAKKLVAEYLHSEASNTLAVMSTPDSGTSLAQLQLHPVITQPLRGDDAKEDGMSDGSDFTFGSNVDGAYIIG